MVLPEGVEAMDVCQDIDSMDIDSPLNSKDEGEHQHPFPGEIITGKQQVRYMKM